MLIHPNGMVSPDTTYFYLLEAPDSYLGEIKYFALKSFKKKISLKKTPIIKQDIQKIVAKKREEGAKKPKKEQHKLGKKLDDVIVHLVEHIAILSIAKSGKVSSKRTVESMMWRH